MKTIRFFLLWCMVVAISACTPFYRGFEGSTLVSPARPDVSVSVVDMPMLAHGQIAPFLNTDQLPVPGNPCLRIRTDAASPVALWPFPLCPATLGNGTRCPSAGLWPSRTWGPCLAERASTGASASSTGPRILLRLCSRPRISGLPLTGWCSVSRA